MDSLRAELLHDRSGVSVTMVQMPALNTPQFGWVKSRLPRRAQPVPPIFQPEVAARAIVWAADHHPPAFQTSALLISSNGERVFNTLRPFGQPLPRAAGLLRFRARDAAGIVLLAAIMLGTLWRAGTHPSWCPDFDARPLFQTIVGTAAADLVAGAHGRTRDVVFRFEDRDADA